MAGEDLVGRTAKTGGQENTQELDIGHGIRKRRRRVRFRKVTPTFAFVVPFIFYAKSLPLKKK